MPIKSQLIFTGGCLAGALGMYYADPHRGAYRRALLRDKSLHLRKELIKKAEVAGRDLGHRTRGVVSTARSRFFPEPVADDILVARVGSKVGRVVANPHSIGVTADRGRVLLSGPLFSDELETLLHIVKKIPGVRSIDNKLDPHGRSERFPGLQGHRRLNPGLTKQGLGFLALTRKSWPPALRLLISVAGGIAAVSGSVLALRKGAA